MLKLENIRKVFNAGTVNEKVALNGLNLHMKEGEFSSDVSFYRYNIELGNSEWYNHTEIIFTR